MVQSLERWDVRLESGKDIEEMCNMGLLAEIYKFLAEEWKNWDL